MNAQRSISIATLLALGPSAYGQLTGTLGAHDPSTLIKDGNTYRYFATGNGISSRRSTNMTAWQSGGSVFSSPPAWTTTAVPGFGGNFWAPDISFFDGEYHLYYSVSSFGSQVSAIGLVTNPTLDPTSPSFGWTDQGAVIQSQIGSPYNTIDPAIYHDTDGRSWMSFGSFWDGIFITELNPATGKRLNPATPPTRLADKSEIEAAYIYKRDGFYYLFVNWGFCCQGVNSTYNMRLGRSTSVTGPYLDKTGASLASGGGSLFLGTEAQFIGPGHAGIFSEAGQDWFSFHYYNGNNNGSATYNLRKLYWDSGGWPSAVGNAAWTGGGGGDWSQQANWVGTTPDGIGHIASFGSISSGQFAVAIDGGLKTLGNVTFDNAGGYTIGSAGGNALILDVATGSVLVNVVNGNHTIAAPVTLNDNLTMTINPAAGSLAITGPFNASGKTITRNGAGTLRLENLRAAGLTLNAGKVQISPKSQPNDPAGTSVVNSLSIAASGQLDLANNAMVLDFTGPIGTTMTTIRQHLLANRMTSSLADAMHRLGYGDNAILGRSSFAGQTADATSVLIGFVHAGDGNLDGIVDITDLGNLATHWQASSDWQGGDVDYNGFVDITDLGMLATNWQAGASLSEALAAMGLASPSVPEPQLLATAGIAMINLRRIHRRSARHSS